MKIKDIARELNMSMSTVSKALNGGFDVSKETKELIINYAKSHGYKSKEKRLSIKNKRRLCVLFDNVDISLQSNILHPLAMSFSNAAGEKRFEVVYNSVERLNGKTYDDFMNDNKYDGAFVLGLNYKSNIWEELDKTSIPTVVYDNSIVGEKVATINTENINTIVKIVTYLKELGHEKIGFIHGDRNSFVSNERFAGYIIGLIQNGLEYEQKYVYFGRFSKDSGMRAANYFKSTDVTAVVCVSDTIAVGLIRGLEEFDLKVPEDISVTGFDDLDIAKYMKPPLTTIRQDALLIGETALHLLLSIMMNRSSQRIIINGEIILRESTGIKKDRS